MTRTLLIITFASVVVGLLGGLLASPLVSSTQAVGIGAAVFLAGWVFVGMSGVGFPDSLYPDIYRDSDDD